jgi:MraZ protein
VLKHFTGTHDHRMDEKGRVSLPTEFRRVLQAVGSSGALYVVPQLDHARALVFFTTEAYGALIERHNQREYPSLAAQQRMELKLVTRASQIQVDDAGRIVLTKALRDAIGLEKELRFVGVASSFEVWRPDARDAFEAELMAAEADEPVHIDRRGLH